MSLDAAIYFPPFRLDPIKAQLWRDDQEIVLRHKTFNVLVYLANHPGQLITKAKLLDAVWPDVSVSDSMPAVSITELRKALGDESKTPRFIETVHRRGYRFIGRVTTRAPMEPASRPQFVPRSSEAIIVGRGDEMARLLGWSAQVLLGERRVVFVTGEAGIGKTAFVNAFLETVADTGPVRIACGQCVEQYGSGEPYMPVLEALTRLGQGTVGERVMALLDGLAPTWLAQMPALLSAEQSVRLQGQNQGVTQQRMLREMVLALEALAAEAPLVLILEDLHWSDFSTLELIAALARRSESARLMLVGTYRPAEMLAHDHPLRAMTQELELHHQCEEMRLKLLSEQDVESYLERRFSSRGAQTFEGFARAIHERTDGNPLFMVNVIDYLASTQILASPRKASEAASAELVIPDLIEVPGNVRHMIERNFEGLTAEEQAMLQVGSVAGAEFSAAAVAAVLERPQVEVEACCARLARREQFVVESEPIAWPDGTLASGFRFRHWLYQEVLYRLLPLGRRVQLHRLIAAREESGYGERAGEAAAELAHHYSHAHNRDKAIYYLKIAGERAITRGALTEAEDHYLHALGLLSELPQAKGRDQLELSLEIALGGVLWGSRSWSHPDTTRAFARAEQLAEKLGETAQLVLVLRGSTISALGTGQFRLGHDLAEQMLMAAGRINDRASLCAANTTLGQALIWRAQYIASQKCLELANSYYDEDDPSDLAAMGVHAPALEAIVFLLLGFPDCARQFIQIGFQRAERRKSPFWLGMMHLWGGMFCSLMRDPGGTLEHAKELRRLAVNQPVWTGLADVNTGRALMLQNNWEEGATYLRRANALHRSAGLISQLMWAKLDEAELFAHQGSIDAGLDLISGAIADSEELIQIRPPALRYNAELLAENNADAAVIDGAYRAAIACAQNQAAKFYELQATTSFARWLTSQGRIVEAQSVLGQIYGWFTEGFDTVALKEAKALLDRLRSESAMPRRATLRKTD